MSIPGLFVSDAGRAGDTVADPCARTMLETGANDIAPLYSLTERMSRGVATSPIVSWEDHYPVSTTGIVTSNCGDPKGTQIEVANADTLTPRTILYVAETGEFLFVVSCGTGCVITVKRGFACTPCCPIDKDYHLERISTAFEEASDPPNGYTHNQGLLTNCTMILRTGFEISGTAMATQYRSGNIMQRMLRDSTSRHASDKECAMWFSRKHTGIIDGRPWRMMDGIDAQIIQNRFVCPPSGLDRLLLDAFLQRVYTHNIEGQPNERIFMGSSIVITALNEMGWRYSDKNIDFSSPGSHMKFGVKFREYDSIYGPMKVMRNPKLEGKAWGNRLYAIHPGGLKMFDMEGRMNMFQSDGPGQNNNGSSTCLRDSHKAVMTTEMSLALMQQSVHAVMTDIVPCYYRD